MGFTSIFIADICSEQWPQWFKKKYSDAIGFESYCIYSKKPKKLYFHPMEDLHEDIQKVLIDVNYKSLVTIVYLHECNGITKVKINQSSIIIYEPSKYEKSDTINHRDWCDHQEDV